LGGGRGCVCVCVCVVGRRSLTDLINATQMFEADDVVGIDFPMKVTRTEWRHMQISKFNGQEERNFHLVSWF
jgi:hypothetical protein